MRWTGIGSGKSSEPIGLNRYLLGLALACLLPIVIVSAIAIWQAGRAYKDSATKRLSDTSRTLADAIEGEIDARFATLSARAALLSHTKSDGHAPPSPKLMRGINLEGDIAFVEAGQPSSVSPVVAAANAAIVRDAPVVSNLTELPNGQGYRIALAMPVDSDDGRQAAAVLSVSPDRLIRTLQQHSNSLDDTLVAVTDGNGRIIARSRDLARAMGKLAPDWKKLKALNAKKGQFEAITTDGAVVMFAFNQLGGTPGWFLVVGEPLTVFNARWRDPLIALVIGVILAWGVATIAAVWVGRQILRPVSALAAHSAAVAAGAASRTPIPASSIREFETLRVSVNAAEKALRDSRRVYRTITEAGSLALWRWTARDGRFSVKGWGLLTGVKDEDGEIFDDAWLKRIHPDDERMVSEAFRKALRARDTVDSEFRLKVGEEDGWRWVRSRGAPIVGDDGQPIEWVGVVEDIDARKQSQDRIAYMAHHDTLTGLGNRTLLRERLEQAIGVAALGEGSALLSIDLDHFKEVNDTFGHPIGDALLRAVAGRLRACARKDDFIARVGGDEFAMIQYADASPDRAAALALRIVETIGAPYEIDGHRIDIGASVGIALVVDAACQLDQYLKRADKALYRAKEEGRGRASFFEQDKLWSEMTALLTTIARHDVVTQRWTGTR